MGLAYVGVLFCFLNGTLGWLDTYFKPGLFCNGQHLKSLLIYFSHSWVLGFFFMRMQFRDQIFGQHFYVQSSVPALFFQVMAFLFWS